MVALELHDSSAKRAFCSLTFILNMINSLIEMNLEVRGLKLPTGIPMLHS